MAINLTDTLNAATTKGKLADAKQIYLEGDNKNLQDAHKDNEDHLSTLDTRSTQIEESLKTIAATGGASNANAVVYDNNISGLTSINVKGALDELAMRLKDEFSYKGIATPTTNPGTPNGNVFYLAGEGSYPNFNNQVVEVGQIAVLKWDGSWHKEVLEIGADGGNMILGWNTDVPTTRKQVLSKYRKPGVQISYKDPNNGWINEQYIGTAVTDTEWVKDTNWSKLPNSNNINNKLSYNQQINLDLILTLDNLQNGFALSSDGNSVVINSGASLSPIIKVNTGDVIKLSSTFVSYSYKDGVVVSKLSPGTIIVDDTFNEVRFSVATASYNTPITILRNRAIGEVSAIRGMMPYINVEEDITKNNKKEGFFLTTSGNYSAKEGSFSTENYMSCVPNQEFFYKGYSYQSAASMVFFDLNKNVVSFVGSIPNDKEYHKIVAPQNAFYFKASAIDTDFTLLLNLLPNRTQSLEEQTTDLNNRVTNSTSVIIEHDDKISVLDRKTSAVPLVESSETILSDFYSDALNIAEYTDKNTGLTGVTLSKNEQASNYKYAIVEYNRDDIVYNNERFDFLLLGKTKGSNDGIMIYKSNGAVSAYTYLISSEYKRYVVRPSKGLPAYDSNKYLKVLKKADRFEIYNSANPKSDFVLRDTILFSELKSGLKEDYDFKLGFMTDRGGNYICYSTIYKFISDSKNIILPGGKNLDEYLQSLNLSSPLAGKTLIATGDSIVRGIIGGVNDQLTYSKIVADKTGMTYIKKDYSGSKLSEMKNSVTSFEEECDIITVSYGVNDWARSNPIELGTLEEMSPNTIYGDIKIMIENTINRYPNALFLMVTPMFAKMSEGTEWWWTNLPDGETNAKGWTIYDISKAIKEVSARYGVPVIDFNSEATISARNSQQNTEYFLDGLHPNEKGYYRLASIYQSALEYYIQRYNLE